MGKRDELRQQQMETIKNVARRFLAQSGPEGIVLRAIAREMGQTSSAMFRYYANRDELLTALILDAYNDLGEHVEATSRKVARREAHDRFIAVALSIREWAVANPHIYGLIFGTPIPGYVAPPDTIAAASRVVLVLAEIFTDVPRGKKGSRGSGFLAHHITTTVGTLLPGRSTDEQGRALLVWSSLFGLISFELFGHFVGSVAQPKRYFEAAVNELWVSFVAP